MTYIKHGQGRLGNSDLVVAGSDIDTGTDTLTYGDNVISRGKQNNIWCQISLYSYFRRLSPANIVPDTTVPLA